MQVEHIIILKQKTFSLKEKKKEKESKVSEIRERQGLIRKDRTMEGLFTWTQGNPALFSSCVEFYKQTAQLDPVTRRATVSTYKSFRQRKRAIQGQVPVFVTSLYQHRAKSRKPRRPNTEKWQQKAHAIEHHISRQNTSTILQSKKRERACLNQ